MQYNLFQWVKIDKPVNRVVHPWEVILKFYIFRLLIEQPVDNGKHHAKGETTLMR